MKISINHLKQYYADLSSDAKAMRNRFDELGLEVKRLSKESSDIILTLELLANRGDHMSYWGVATEFAGRFGGQVKMPELASLKVGKALLTLKNESELCLRYTATILEVDDLSKILPPEILYPLEVAEIHSIDAAVDTTNLVNLELGQPTHLFDADKIKGGITIRLSRQHETAHLLFQEKPTILPGNTLVIADDEKILAIAGVIGCEESKVTTKTKRMILESATFEPVTVRKTARALKINTYSSARFERGADPAMAITAVNRIVWLLEKYKIAHHVHSIQQVGRFEGETAKLVISPSVVQQYFGCELFTGAEVLRRLTQYGFDIQPHKNELLVKVPTHRMWDVINVEDLYEELARSMGYDHLPEKLPSVEKGSLPSHKERVKDKTNHCLVGKGFYEIFTNGFYGRHVIEQLGISENHELYQHVEVINALDKGYSLLKNNCLAQALEAAEHNLRFQMKNFKLFEWAKVFRVDNKSENKLCREKEKLWGIVNGQDKDWVWDGSKSDLNSHYLKGIVEEIGRTIGLKLAIILDREHGLSMSDFLHPYRQGFVVLGRQVVGVIGEVHPKIVKAFGIKRQRPCYFELDVNPLLKRAPRCVVPEKFELPAHLPMERMLAFTLPHLVEAEVVAKCLQKAAPDYLEIISMIDLYRHEEEGQPVRTVTFSLQYSNHAGNRTVEEVNQVTEALSQAVIFEFSSEGVKLRQ